jgi:carbamoyltransferase
MLFNYDVRGPQISGATHADGSARIQTVSRQDNARLNELLAEFEKCCGVHALINTSLNGGGRHTNHGGCAAGLLGVGGKSLCIR